MTYLSTPSLGITYSEYPPLEELDALVELSTPSLGITVTNKSFAHLAEK